METEFRVTIRREGRAAVLALAGELDLASLPRLEDAIDSALESGAEILVLDLAALAFMDVAGLRSVLRGEQRVRAARKRLVLAAPPPGVRRLFALTGQEETLSSFGSVSEALGQDLR